MHANLIFASPQGGYIPCLEGPTIDGDYEAAEDLPSNVINPSAANEGICHDSSFLRCIHRGVRAEPGHLLQVSKGDVLTLPCRGAWPLGLSEA